MEIVQKKMRKINLYFVIVLLCASAAAGYPQNVNENSVKNDPDDVLDLFAEEIYEDLSQDDTVNVETANILNVEANEILNVETLEILNVEALEITTDYEGTTDDETTDTSEPSDSTQPASTVQPEDPEEYSFEWQNFLYGSLTGVGAVSLIFLFGYLLCFKMGSRGSSNEYEMGTYIDNDVAR